MRLLTLLTAAALAALPALAPARADEDIDHLPRVNAVLDGHVLPGFAHLAEATEALRVESESCGAEGPGGADQIAAYHAAFDAWMAVAHLRFGPTEVDDRGFAMGFWPDTKGFTKKALNRLIQAESDIVSDPDRFAKSSIAGRGLFALDYLLFDETMRQAGTPAYRCALAGAIATDLDRNADAMLAGWHGGYADLMRRPGGDGNPYRSDEEALQALYQALLTGLEFNAATRLGRPLGTFDKPRPRRAEAWRSGRSQANVAASMTALGALSALMAEGHPEVAARLDSEFTRAQNALQALDDPSFAGVADPMARFRIEALQTAVTAIRESVTWQLGNALGVREGFNALDGDG